MAHYLISEASRRLNVEAHVLRYWEEELKLEIPRNELGHRYYTEKQLALFQRIKELKELGYQLKAIRTSLDQEEETELKADEAGFLLEKDRESPQADKLSEPRFKILEGDRQEKTIRSGEKRKAEQEDGEMQESENEKTSSGTALSVANHDLHKGLTASPEKMEQFQAIMTDVLAEALRRNNADFSAEVSGRISDKVVKEMNYVLRDREEREEERYRKLDETIRACQRVQKQKNEAAVTRVPDRKARKRRLGFRKRK